MSGDVWTRPAPRRPANLTPSQLRLLGRLWRGPLIAADVALIAETPLTNLAMRPLESRGLVTQGLTPRGNPFWELSEAGKDAAFRMRAEALRTARRPGGEVAAHG